jgi:calcium and integrin-binding protein 1
MSFDDFVNMISVFSEAAPVAVKSRYAFEIYDFGDSKHLRKKDIEQLIKHLVGDKNKFEKKDMDRLVEKV